MRVQLDGRGAGVVSFDAEAFQDFRHGYAGTIYKGQGRTLDQTYLYHSEHWRSAASYVALTRHRDKAEVFAARNTAADVRELARQMARADNRKAASHYYQAGGNAAGESTSQSRALEPAPIGREPSPGANEEHAPDNFEADLAAARRAAAMQGSAERAEHQIPANDDPGVDGREGKQRSRDRGGGRSL
jgi:hypothetical protein